MTKQEKELEKVVAPVVEGLGYGLYDIEYLKEGQDWFLRVYITHPEKNIDLDDCEKVSDAVSEVLDETDPIETSYSLEISSCGLEPKLREQKHFEAAVGKNIELKLYKPVEGQKLVTGILQKLEESGIWVKQVEQEASKKHGKQKKSAKKLSASEVSQMEELSISFENISSAKILFDWEESENG
ncbi:MAG: ribosome maturation factor RimP [Clostridia bacterium]|nr:ribosome maturation factor RimP [Clostridia bacterium]